MPEQESVPQEQAPEASHRTEEVDVADEEDLDVVMERVPGRRRRGGFGWFSVLLIIALLVVAGILLHRHHQQQVKIRQEQERQNLETQYQAAEQQCIDKVKHAADAAKAGDITAALDLLEVAQAQWKNAGEVATSAKDAGRVEAAKAHREALKAAVVTIKGEQAEAEKLTKRVADLEGQVKAATAQRDALHAKVRDEILQLAAPGAAGKVDQNAPASEPDAGETPAGP